MVTQPRFAEYLTVGEAAQVLGVSPWTLRNWDNSGKLKPRRRPKNGYRIYRHEDLQWVLGPSGSADGANGHLVPEFDWSAIGGTEHFVQFYESDAYLIDSVSEFVGPGLSAGEGAIVIATPAHCKALLKKLKVRGIDIVRARENGQYVVVDAADALSKFMVDGLPDRQRFVDVIGGVVGRVARERRHIRAFGEMVALLWAEGNHAAAIRLEELWNELAKVYCFSLFCAYPMRGFGNSADSKPLRDICTCHARVVPPESYATLASSDDRFRAITLLQHKAQSLEAEIAHRTEVEGALAQREQELADFLENSLEGLHKVGPDGTILWANKAELNLLGYEAEEYVGHHIAEFHVDRPVIDEMLLKLQRGESLYDYPARLRCKNGSIKHVVIYSNAFFEDGEFLYTRCFTRDVTERWRAEEGLRAADRRKDEFLAALAHELRSPLSPVCNALQLLHLTDDLPPGVTHLHGIIERQVNHMVRLVDDLLDVSRITSGKITLRKESVDLSAIIATAVETIRPAINAAGHQLALGLPREAVTLHADAVRIAQVIANLLNNAAKYTGEGGQIWLTARGEGNEAVVSVRDNGPGISAEMLPRIFNLFSQVDGTLDRSQGGLGIGLTLARSFVELHGGRIEARSAGAGQGSEFIVYLPAEPATFVAAPVAPPRMQETRLPARRILLVDDTPAAGFVLGKLLEKMGQHVRTTDNAASVLRFVEAERPDVVISDIAMPDMDGFELARQLRQSPELKGIVLVALTGYGQDTDRQKSKDAGFDFHLVKPVSLEALQDLLASLPTPPVAVAS